MCESHSSFGSFCFQKLQSETDLVPETWVMPINHGYYENVKKGKQIKYLDERSCKRLHIEKLFEIDIIFITVII